MTAPANDDFANAEVVTGLTGTVSWTNVDATVESGEYYDGLAIYTVWYVWTCPDPAPPSITFTISSSVDTYLTILDGFAGPNQFAENHTASDGLVTFVPTANDVYYLYVQDGTGVPGSGDIVWAPSTETGVLVVVTSDGTPHQLCCDTTAGNTRLVLTNVSNEFSTLPSDPTRARIFVGGSEVAGDNELATVGSIFNDDDDGSYIEAEYLNPFPGSFPAGGDVRRVVTTLAPAGIPAGATLTGVFITVRVQVEYNEFETGGFIGANVEVIRGEYLGPMDTEFVAARFENYGDHLLTEADGWVEMFLANVGGTDDLSADTLADLRAGTLTCDVGVTTSHALEEKCRISEVEILVTWTEDAGGKLFLVLGPDEVYQQCCDEGGTPLYIAGSDAAGHAGPCMVPYTL